MKFRTLTDNMVHGVLLNALYCAARTYDQLSLVQDVQGMSNDDDFLTIVTVLMLLMVVLVMGIVLLMVGNVTISGTVTSITDTRGIIHLTTINFQSNAASISCQPSDVSQVRVGQHISIYHPLISWWACQVTPG